MKKAINLPIITLTNDGFIDYTENLIESLKKQNLEKNLTVYCIGNKSYNYFKDTSIKTTKLKSNIFTKTNIFQDWRSKNFNRLMLKKVEIIFDSLSKNNRVLYTDGDVVFLDNELKELTGDEGLDIIAQHDFNPNEEIDTLCAGFMMINSNKRTLNFFNPKNIPKELTDRRFLFDDQKYINRNKDKLNVKLLENASYPNGAYFYKNYRSIEPKVIHFNYIVGHQKKETMKKYNYWYLNSL